MSSQVRSSEIVGEKRSSSTAIANSCANSNKSYYFVSSQNAANSRTLIERLATNDPVVAQSSASQSASSSSSSSSSSLFKFKVEFFVGDFEPSDFKLTSRGHLLLLEASRHAATTVATNSNNNSNNSVEHFRREVKLPEFVLVDTLSCYLEVRGDTNEKNVLVIEALIKKDFDLNKSLAVKHHHHPSSSSSLASSSASQQQAYKPLPSSSSKSSSAIKSTSSSTLPLSSSSFHHLGTSDLNPMTSTNSNNNNNMEYLKRNHSQHMQSNAMTSSTSTSAINSLSSAAEAAVAATLTMPASHHHHHHPSNQHQHRQQLRSSSLHSPATQRSTPQALAKQHSTATVSENTLIGGGGGGDSSLCYKFDLKDFDSKNISITVKSNNVLCIHARKQIVDVNGHKNAQEFRHEIQLPPNALIRDITNCFDEATGCMTIDIPVTASVSAPPPAPIVEQQQQQQQQVQRVSNSSTKSRKSNSSSCNALNVNASQASTTAAAGQRKYTDKYLELVFNLYDFNFENLDVFTNDKGQKVLLIKALKPAAHHNNQDYEPSAKSSSSSYAKKYILPDWVSPNDINVFQETNNINNVVKNVLIVQLPILD